MITTHEKGVPLHTVTAISYNTRNLHDNTYQGNSANTEANRFYKEMIITVKHRTKTQLKIFIENVWSCRKENLTLPLMAGD
jgi:hypothetical protein